MNSRVAIVFALALVAATSSGCISFTYTRSLTPAEEEEQRRVFAEAIRADLRKSELVLRLLDVIVSEKVAPGAPLGISVKSREALGQLFSGVIRDAGDASRKGAQVVQQIMGVMQAVGVDPPKYVDQPKDLKLAVVDTGVPLAYVDTATGVFTIDALVLRAIFIAGVAKSYGDEDLETHLSDLRAAKQLDAEGRRNSIDMDAEARFKKLPTTKKKQSADPQLTATTYVQAIREIFSMPDGVYHARYQLPDGKVVNPRSIAWDLHAPQALTQTLQASVMGAFNTVLLHEIGHVALRHRPDPGLSCERRRMMELEADGYSAALRAVGRLDSKYPLSAGFIDQFTMAIGGVVEAEGIDSFYSIAYRVSGFDAGLLGVAPSTRSCYPSAKDRQVIAEAINKAIAKRASEQAQEWVNKCIEGKMSETRAEDLKTLEEGGRVSQSVDFLRDCK